MDERKGKEEKKKDAFSKLLFEKKINNSTKGVDVISSSSVGLRHLQKLRASLTN